MNTSNNPAAPRAEIPLQPPTSNGSLSRGVDVVGRSARRAEAAIKTHPYFTAGVVTGLGLAIGGALVLRARRRRSFVDFLTGWL